MVLQVKSGDAHPLSTRFSQRASPPQAPGSSDRVRRAGASRQPKLMTSAAALNKKRITAMSRFNTRSPEMSIRPARDADLEAICEVHDAAFDAQHRPLLGGSSALPGWWNPSLKRLQLTPCFVAEGAAGVGVVGFVYITPPWCEGFYDEYGGGNVILDDLYVHPEHQGTHVGSRLLRQAEAYAVQCGHGGMSLACLAVNSQAQAFYRRHSWQPEPAGSAFTSPADGRRYLVFTKRLSLPRAPAAATSAATAPGMRELTPQQLSHFMEHGFVVVRRAIDAQLCEQWRTQALERVGVDPSDPGTYPSELTGVPSKRSLPVDVLAPRAWAAMCDLIGGPQRAAAVPSWSDGFALNLGSPGCAWHPPAADFAGAGWHKDGWMFRHFLDSPEQGLLCLVCWSDILPRSGGTFFSPDSIGAVARLLARVPTGLHPNAIPSQQLIGECHDFRECVADAGDVYLCHPFMMHSVSANPSGRPRFLTNGNVRLLKPMRFGTEEAAAAAAAPALAHVLSPVELVTVRALHRQGTASEGPTAPVQRPFSFKPDEKARAPDGLGNGAWPVMPPPERGPDDEALHAAAGLADRAHLEGIIAAVESTGVNAVAAAAAAGNGSMGTHATCRL
jgi:ribosomal protein S18 acetylase RimI-like enzyme